MKDFVDLLKESVLVQSLLTLIVWSVLGYLVLSGKTIPDIMSSAGMLILGFYFGSKSQMAQRVATNEVIKSVISSIMERKGE